MATVAAFNAATMQAAGSRSCVSREACALGSTACCISSSQRRGVQRLATMSRLQPGMRCSAWTGSSSSSSSSRCRRRRQCAARAAAEAEAQQQAGALVPDRQGYRSFQLEEAEFLVAQTPEGKLDLRDVYVAARGEGGAAPAFTRLQAEGAVPQPQDYHDVPWYTEYPGDALAEKLGKQWLWRVYLVPLASREPLQMSFEGLWMLDGKTASLQPVQVHRLAPPDTPQHELRLRIREEVVTVDTAESLPDWETAVQSRIHGVPALSELETARLEAYLRALEEARAAGAMEEAEFQTAYNAHWLAGMLAGAQGAQALSGGWDSSGEARADDEALVAEAEPDNILGGWDQEMFEDLMQQYDDDEGEEGEYDDYDAPATDY